MINQAKYSSDLDSGMCRGPPKLIQVGGLISSSNGIVVTRLVLRSTTTKLPADSAVHDNFFMGFGMNR